MGEYAANAFYPVFGEHVFGDDNPVIKDKSVPECIGVQEESKAKNQPALQFDVLEEFRTGARSFAFPAGTGAGSITLMFF